jgi:FtsP/CotA-like multicopper oxidase with cupredoxin domain
LGGVRRALAATAAEGLSDPADQPKFQVYAPNALHPDFIYSPTHGKAFYRVGVEKIEDHVTGLVDGDDNPLTTPVWGYGQDGVGTWPGMTFQVQKDQRIEVRWENNLFGEPHLLPVDTSVHWAYSLHGYEDYTIEDDGVPIVTHVHGGHTLYLYDGNPEQFVSPGYKIRGPHWRGKTYIYQNDQVAGNLWYHDHALGITRLNVYAGLAGFYFIRDEFDTGKPDNPLGLPAYPYELAYAIQDRMFKANGELFYPSVQGDPFWSDFITGEDVDVCPDDPEDPDSLCIDPNEPTALAEFFGDHMVVNGKIWPKEDVEPRNYRMRLLNGTDSRFMAIRFRKAADLNAESLDGAGPPLTFTVVGSDQGLASEATETEMLVFEPGSRYDIVFNFAGLEGERIIMENVAGDAPFGGDLFADLSEDEIADAVEAGDLFPDRQTDRIMAFDVVLDLYELSDVEDEFDPENIAQYGGNTAGTDLVRKVALFEGKDEYGRLQPLLGTVADDLSSATAYTWSHPTTENPDLNATEVWEIYNFTGDAHPIHLHLVNFEILGRNQITFDVDEDNPDQVLQHNGTYGTVAAISNIVEGAAVTLDEADGYVENAPKDMVTALPEQVTRIKATFDKPGRYVWHCHILSHEDHEMMRVLHVGGGA